MKRNRLVIGFIMTALIFFKSVILKLLKIFVNPIKEWQMEIFEKKIIPITTILLFLLSIIGSLIIMDYILECIGKETNKNKNKEYEQDSESAD